MPLQNKIVFAIDHAIDFDNIQAVSNKRIQHSYFTKHILGTMKKGIIIGAGIGGLTTAIALLKKGIDVSIYEQAPELNEVGAGLWIAPNGLRVFSELGLADEIIQAGKSLDKISVVDNQYNPISIIDGHKIKQKHGYCTVAIHRSTLQKILASYIPPDKIILNKKFNAYNQSADSITAEFEDGTVSKGDFLIAADGIWSKARVQLNTDVQIRYSGQTCWRFVTDFDMPSGEDNHMYEIWSNQKGLRVGYSKINERQIYVYITHCEKAGGHDNPETRIKDLVKLSAEFTAIVRELILSTKGKGILRNDLVDFKPLKKWTDGRMALMGDAAHATTPNLGQGACQAIEDAYVLAHELSIHNDVEKSLKSFEEKRIKKATYITNTSWQFAQITNTSGLLKSILMGVLRLTPHSINEKQLDKIYSLDW